MLLKDFFESLIFFSLSLYHNNNQIIFFFFFIQVLSVLGNQEVLVVVYFKIYFILNILKNFLS